MQHTHLESFFVYGMAIVSILFVVFNLSTPELHQTMSSAESNQKLNVLIIDDGGNLGAHIVNGFQLPQYAPKVNLTLLVRQSTTETTGPKKDELDKFVAQGAKLVYGDLATSTEAELIATLKGQDVILSAVGPLQAGDQARLIPAAKAAGVKWFIPSEYGYDNAALPAATAAYSPPVAVKTVVLNSIKEAGFDYTVIHSGAFSELLVLPLWKDLKTITAPISFDTKTVTTTLATIGLLTADAVVTGRGRNQVIKFGQTFSFGEITDLVEAASGAKFTRVVQSIQECEAAVAANQKDLVARFHVVLGSAQGRGTVWPASETYEVKYQIPVQTFPELVKKVFVENRSTNESRQD